MGRTPWERKHEAGRPQSGFAQRKFTKEETMEGDAKAIIKVILTVAIVIFTFTGAGMYGCPQYNVWQQGLAGQAELKRAEQNRQIRVQEAHARLESSKLDALSEVERAKGVAQANEIVADGLGGAEGYLRYL